MASLVQERGPLPLAEACAFIHQAALALQRLHDRGLVHHHLRPANIMVTPKSHDDEGKVHFLSGAIQSAQDYEDLVFDEVNYLAPEQALPDHNVDIRADIYSLGATFYFLLTGRTLWGEATVAQKLIWHQTRRPKPVSTYRSDVPLTLQAIIDKMLAKDPDERYQTPAEVVAALDVFFKGLS